MCGICGIVSAAPTPELEAAVRPMMAAMVHRGPDDEGLAAARGAALGIRRLSIIDLAGGHQPISNETGSVTVVLNGEIYNFAELRRELEGHGHVFRTQSDTEAVVQAFEEWGEDCVHRLRGMFALAVLVRGKRPEDPAHVFLARDRFGIKPLYYARAGGAFLFASEVRALLASGLVAPQLSAAGLEHYLLFGSVGEPLTLIEGVHSLPPGHRMWVDASRPGEGAPQAYWKPPAPSQRGIRREAAVARLRELLAEAVRLHLIADVPLGVFLSSGVDSSAIAALAARERSAIHSVTVVFREAQFNEAAIAGRTAHRLGATHRELVLSEEEMLTRTGEAVAALDQPSMDGINTYFVSWAARQAGLTVALSGLGGDEVFGGYPTFDSASQFARVVGMARHVPEPLRAATAPAVATLTALRSSPDAARKVASAWQDPEALPQPFYFMRALFTPAQAGALLNGRNESATPSAWLLWLGAVAREAERFDEFTAVSWLEARSYMVNTLLRDTDSVSMAHSLEVRVPLLDHDVFEFVALLPPEWKRGSRPKALLLEALAGLIPEEVLAKPKQTFTLPWERWLRGALKQRVETGLANLAAPLRATLNPAAVAQVWSDFLGGRTSWSRPWSLYVLNEWARRHLSATC